MTDCITMIKYQGLGNDYLVLDPNKNRVQLQGKKVALMCQRGFGLGADGVLYGPVDINGKMGVHIYNSDGSEAAISGNGAVWAFDYDKMFCVLMENEICRKVCEKNKYNSWMKLIGNYCFQVV